MSQRYLGLFLLFLLFSWQCSAQVRIAGEVVAENSYKPIEEATITLDNISTTTNADGVFLFENEEIPLGEQVLKISKAGFVDRKLPIVISEFDTLQLGKIGLKPQTQEGFNHLGVISLTDEELDEDIGSTDNIAGLLQATKDVFLSAAAYDFSSTFFKPRGLDSKYSKVLINGVEMNQIFNGRPSWSTWGGLNDAQRNQIFSRNTTASDYTFGGFSGTTNIIMRASKYSEGGKISYARANRSYRNRFMASYNSGMLNNGWAFSILASRRYAEEGFAEGTLYKANSIFISAEKKLNDQHSLNLTAFYTPNIRGKRSPNTQEVVDLKGIKYNSYWGYQDGEIRNSRIKTVKQPVFMLNHYFQISEKTLLNTNLAYQTGFTASSRLDYGGSQLVYGPDDQEIYIGGGSNPDPAYYQYLPSYFLKDGNDPDYESAYLAEQEFLDDAQLDWNSLYAANMALAAQGKNALYVLYEDVQADDQLTLNSILFSEISERITLNASVSWKNLTSHNYAEVEDLLGGNAFLDVDSFAENADEAQSDLQNRNRLVDEGDKFKYNFKYHATILEAFAQTQIDLNRLKLYAGIKTSYTNYQREGHYQNGNFPENSLGKSKLLEFTGVGFKAGLNYKIFGNHFLALNAAQLAKPPNLRNSFSNSRQNNDVVIGLENEQNLAIDFSYIFRSAKFNLRFTAFYNQLYDATEISFYYADGISGIETQNTSTAFVQEVLSDIDKTHIGVEFGAEYRLTSTVKVKAAGSMGNYTYSNNPFLYLTSDDFDEPIIVGASHLENYHIAGGPENVGQLAIEYRDPDYWWFGASYNYFSEAYIDPSPLTRTKNFYQDPIDGLPFNDYDEAVAEELLKQENFGGYGLVNLVGGKTWFLEDYFFGFFASINNIFSTKYRTGGFEQSRNANYRTLKEDKARDLPLFAPKYWFGYGTTYYLNFYVRF